jgi:hypothetical protein
MGGIDLSLACPPEHCQRVASVNTFIFQLLGDFQNA